MSGVCPAVMLCGFVILSGLPVSQIHADEIIEPNTMTVGWINPDATTDSDTDSISVGM